MNIPAPPEGTTGDESGPVLDSIGISAFEVRHPADADRRSEHEPQLQADVTAPPDGGSVSIVWYFGDEQVGDDATVLDGGESVTLTDRVAWSELSQKGLIGSHEYRAELTQTGETVSYGSVTVHEQEGRADDTDCPDGYYYDEDTNACLQSADGDDPNDPSGGDDQGDSDEPAASPSTPSSSALALLPPVGGLSSTMTTLAAAGGLLLLVVIL
ncbi:hypothetical protein [Halostella salina]|uniref:hypothetical protein n=1 Tax=Halostella salina TaxID=1547897 RepID=UPI000EF790AF|nr:hypothetical protein [Halostella salina]